MQKYYIIYLFVIQFQTSIPNIILAQKKIRFKRINYGCIINSVGENSNIICQRISIIFIFQVSSFLSFCFYINIRYVFIVSKLFSSISENAVMKIFPRFKEFSAFLLYSFCSFNSCADFSKFFF